MSPARKTPWGAVLVVALVGIATAGVVGWWIQLGMLDRRIAQKRQALQKLVVTGRIPPNQDVMDYLVERGQQLEAQHGHWQRLAIIPVPKEAGSSDPQLYFRERLHAVRQGLERLSASSGLTTPEQLGLPKELPPSDAVPRLLVQLTLIEDAASLILAHKVSSLSLFKVEDPVTIQVRGSKGLALLRLPVRVRLAGPLPIVTKVLGAVQHAKPMMDLEGVQMTPGTEPDELEVELVLARYLSVVAPQGGDEKDGEEALTKRRKPPAWIPGRKSPEAKTSQTE